MDTQGLLLGVLVHVASVQDADGAGGLLRRIKPLYCWLRTVFADSIYNRVAALLACFLLGITLIVVGRIPGIKGFVVLPRRWVVERTKRRGGLEAAQRFSAEPAGQFAQFWRDPASRTHRTWTDFRQWSQPSQEAVAAGFEHLGRRAT